jgi:hypothetical protein
MYRYAHDIPSYKISHVWIQRFISYHNQINRQIYILHSHDELSHSEMGNVLTTVIYFKRLITVRCFRQLNYGAHTTREQTALTLPSPKSNNQIMALLMVGN